MTDQPMLGFHDNKMLRWNKSHRKVIQAELILRQAQDDGDSEWLLFCLAMADKAQWKRV